MSKRSIDFFFNPTKIISNHQKIQILRQAQSQYWKPKPKIDNEFTLDPLEANNPYYEIYPGKRIGIWKYTCDKKAEIRREYIGVRPY